MAPPTRSTHPATRQLGERECLHLLDGAPYGRLAVIAGDRPQVFPVNHVVRAGGILIRTGSGTKLISAVGSMVAFQADGLAPTGTAWSVQVTGRAAEVIDVREILELIPWLAQPWEEGVKPHVVRIEIEEITGVSFLVQPQD
ncbi:MAG: pyridoxamine 5'-phosphate oxidase family protein [Intrasporangium sp.]|uniref:pyridoxamine 5'-phosphate oxidase family protein n=1 Tax=Intrasporangium sp. TaxID=1925024 RepID=UPI002648BCC5|nr:pyridoxamine 5'-phosphate oxidase family protein [Intrasporangium sp.]MDN5795646.1 pyridoxamine 5'-phosphate oxidase family protein [Intrasporangium sp.]